MLTAALLAALLSFQEAPAAPPGGEHMIVNPNWVRRPSAEDLTANWPLAAARAGTGGSASIKCLVAETGALYDCSIFSETPAGGGFGAAALVLSSQFRMRPKTVDGKLTNNGSVIIPIVWEGGGVGFDNAGGGGYRQVLPQGAVWLTSPTPADVAAAYPMFARVAKRSGLGIARCHVEATGKLSGCNALGADPSGLGSGAARLARFFTLSPPAPSKGPSAGVLVDLPVAFEYAALAAPRTPVKPVWAQRPSPAEVAATVGGVARAKGLSQVSLVESCVVGEGGWLKDCRAKGEAAEGPPDVAALAAKFRMSTWSMDGYPTVGAPYELRLEWKAPGPAAPAA